jgi:hypothetical protein
MADKNIQMQERNADNTDWERIYPVTLSTNVKLIDPATGRTFVIAIQNGLPGVLEVAPQ